MCFSAAANFIGAPVVGAVGAATLAQVRHPRELVFASLPLLFAVHQFAEGFVWLGLQGQVSPGLGAAAAYFYLLYAQGVLPALMPLGVLLIEPSRHRRRFIAPFLALGIAAGIYLFWVDAAEPVTCRIVNHSIAYENAGSLVGLFAVLYVVAVVGAALFSGYRWIIAFGVANLIGLTATQVLLATSFTSIWCAYAAVVSVMILLFFLRRRRHERTAGDDHGDRGVTASPRAALPRSAKRGRGRNEPSEWWTHRR